METNTAALLGYSHRRVSLLSSLAMNEEWVSYTEHWVRLQWLPGGSFGSAATRHTPAAAPPPHTVAGEWSCCGGNGDMTDGHRTSPGLCELSSTDELFVTDGGVSRTVSAGVSKHCVVIPRKLDPLELLRLWKCVSACAHARPMNQHTGAVLSWLRDGSIAVFAVDIIESLA